MDQNFSISICSLIKFRISCRNVIESNLVRDDEGGFGASVHDHVAKVAVVCFYVGLASSDVEPLFHSISISFSSVLLGNTSLLP